MPFWILVCLHRKNGAPFFFYYSRTKHLALITAVSTVSTIPITLSSAICKQCCVIYYSGSARPFMSSPAMTNKFLNLVHLFAALNSIAVRLLFVSMPYSNLLFVSFGVYWQPYSPGPPLPGWAGHGPASASPPTKEGGTSRPSPLHSQLGTLPAEWSVPVEKYDPVQDSKSIYGEHGVPFTKDKSVIPSVYTICTQSRTCAGTV